MIARLAIAPAMVLLLTAPGTLLSRDQPSSGPVEREAFLMGTRARLVAWAPTREEGLARLDRGLLALEETEGELSTWRPDSAISALNRTPVGREWQASPSLCSLVSTLRDWHIATGGTFDPAIGPLTDVWGIHDSGRVPGAGDLERARRRSGFSHLRVNTAHCTVVRRTDVSLDVGAFGKGEALDRARTRMGDDPWMIDLGGQVAVGGIPPGREEDGWSIAIAHPLDRDRPALEITLRGGSLSTSAGSERDRYVGGRRVGHIIDPRSGTPATFEGSVSVWHERALVADILSTALYVMGPDEGLRWAERTGIAACYLLPAGSAEVRLVATTLFQSSVLSFEHSQS